MLAHSSAFSVASLFLASFNLPADAMDAPRESAPYDFTAPESSAFWVTPEGPWEFDGMHNATADSINRIDNLPMSSADAGLG